MCSCVSPLDDRIMKLLTSLTAGLIFLLSDYSVILVVYGAFAADRLCSVILTTVSFVPCGWFTLFYCMPFCYFIHFIVLYALYVLAFLLLACNGMLLHCYLLLSYYLNMCCVSPFCMILLCYVIIALCNCLCALHFFLPCFTALVRLPLDHWRHLLHPVLLCKSLCAIFLCLLCSIA